MNRSASAAAIAWLACAAVCTVAPRASALDMPDGASTLRSLFPASNQIAGWALQAPPRLYAGDQVFDYMDGAGEIPRGYGLRMLASAKYFSGKTTLEAAIFDLGAGANAFGYFSARRFLERNPRIRDRAVPLDHPARLYPPVGVLTLWKDRYTVILQPDIGRPPDDVLIRFARAISQRIRSPGTPPALLKRLPRGMTSGTERYVRGKAAFDGAVLFSPKDALRASQGAEAAAADYPAIGMLAVVHYPSHADAAAALTAWRADLVARRATFARGAAGVMFSGLAAREKGFGAAIRGDDLELVTGALHAATVEQGLRMLRQAESTVPARR